MTGAEVALGVVAAAGVGVSIYGQIHAAQAQADADRRNAAIKNAQGDELLSREAINESIMQEQGDLAANHLGARSEEYGPSLGDIARLKNNLANNLALSSRDANFKASMLRAGASQDMSLASDAITAGYISSAGTLLGGVGQGISLYQKNSKSPGLGDKPYGSFNDPSYRGMDNGQYYTDRSYGY